MVFPCIVSARTVDGSGDSSVVFSIDNVKATPEFKGPAAITMKRLTFVFTGDDAGSGTSPFTTNDSETNAIKGWYIYRVRTIGNSGVTEVTESSDLYIYETTNVDIDPQSGVTAEAYTFDLLNGNGVDQVDNTANREIYPAINGQPAAQPVAGTLTVTISNNAVAYSRYAITIDLIPNRD